LDPDVIESPELKIGDAWEKLVAGAVCTRGRSSQKRRRKETPWWNDIIIDTSQEGGGSIAIAVQK
jgi:hypothetical protein